MSDLVAFLNARLDEDERHAPDVHDISADGFTVPETSHDCICGHPARVLREVEAKRKILAEHEDNGCSDLEFHRILEKLAAVWSEHPDYDPAWSA